MAQLAIKGHKIRGNEVIEILEMLGGNNINKYRGQSEDLVYFINSDYYGYIGRDTESNIHSYNSYSLEDFLDKFPYKVGDKVQAWINGYCGIFNIQDMKWDSIANEIKYKIHEYYHSVDNIQPYPYKEETMEEKLEQIILEIPAGYEFFGINDDNKVVLTKKQLKYPQTYKECCEVIGLTGCMPTDNLWYKFGLILAFYQLFICRDAYWKIAGEEMGLGEPWEPDWSSCEDKFCITIFKNKQTFDYSQYISRILAFPTEEIRDTFYKNFKDLIEQCKELL